MQKLQFKSLVSLVLVVVVAAQPPGHLRGPPGQNKPKPNRPFNPQGPQPSAIPPAQGPLPVQSGPVPAVNSPNAAVNAPQTGPTLNGNNISGLMGVLNGGNLGSASAGGAGNGAVENGAAIGQGTAIANAAPGGFGIGLGIGGAIATPLGNVAFGTGESIAVGK